MSSSIWTRIQSSSTFTFHHVIITLLHLKAHAAGTGCISQLLKNVKNSKKQKVIFPSCFMLFCTYMTFYLTAEKYTFSISNVNEKLHVIIKWTVISWVSVAIISTRSDTY